jgi:KaiC/GvpD/RAD55 family RecA-like ATPase
VDKESEYFYKAAISQPALIDNVNRFVFNTKTTSKYKNSLLLFQKSKDDGGQVPAVFPFIDSITPASTWAKADQIAFEDTLGKYTRSKFQTDIDDVDAGSEDSLLADYRDRVYQGDLPPENVGTYGSKADIYNLTKKLAKNKEAMIPTGLKSLDKYFGFRKKAVVIAIGITGIGKSIFCTNLAMQQLKAAKRVLYISTEMEQEDVADRIFRAYYEVETLGNEVLLTRPEISGSLRIVKVMADVAVASDFKSYIRDFKPDFVVIDYLGQMTTNQKYASDYEKYGLVSNEIDTLARTMDVPIFTVSQSNRSTQTKEGASSDKVGHAAIGDSHKILRPVAVAFNILRTSEDAQVDAFTIDLFKNRFGQSGVSFNLFVDYKKMLIADSLIPSQPAPVVMKPKTTKPAGLPGQKNG